MYRSLHSLFNYLVTFNCYIYTALENYKRGVTATQNSVIMNPRFQKALNLEDDSTLPITIWNVIQFRKTFELYYSLDTSKILSDKSCYPSLSKWTQLYDICGFKIQHHQVPPLLERDETRYLKGQLQEIKDVIGHLIKKMILQD